jgi:hypothetical protein
MVRIEKPRIRDHKTTVVNHSIILGEQGKAVDNKWILKAKAKLRLTFENKVKEV